MTSSGHHLIQTDHWPCKTGHEVHETGHWSCEPGHRKKYKIHFFYFKKKSEKTSISPSNKGSSQNLTRPIMVIYHILYFVYHMTPSVQRYEEGRLFFLLLH